MDEAGRQERRIGSIIGALERSFGVPKWRGKRPVLETLISGILSQNTNDRNRDRAYELLRERFPKWEDVLRARSGSVAAAIRVGGLANQRAKRIKGLLSWVKETYGGFDLQFICEMEPEEATGLLLPLKGVGIKTVRVVLLFACGKDVFPVDTHILRVSRRLGLLPPNCSAWKAHQIMGGLVPGRRAYSFHLNLIRLGRVICKPRGPLCWECPISRWCGHGRDLSGKSQ